MIVKIKEGRNNEVYLLKEKKRKFIFKKYKSIYETKYTRFSTEKIFIEFLKKKKIRNIPKIIFSNKKEKIIHFNFIKGSKIKKAQKKHLNKCLVFLKKINHKTSYKKFKFQNASDACLSIESHIQTCESRLSKLIVKYRNYSSLNDKKIFKFLKNSIIPEFKKVKLRINNLFSKYQIVKKLDKEEMILSPSDFGFHNIILTNKELFFIDFEYAGWDDPNKLISDFFLNPDYSISKKNKKYFLSNFDKVFKKTLSNSHKFRLILKIHFLKWVCVIINQINSTTLKRHNEIHYFKKAVKYFETNKNILK